LYIIAHLLAPAPLPPPRRKTQDPILQSNESASQSNDNPPDPKPRPKPRPDRISVDNLVADDPVIIKPKEETETRKIERVSSASLRNPLARYGVKVLPDNVVKERADRLARQAYMEQSLDLENSFDEPPKKSAAPPPPISSKSETQNRLTKTESSSSIDRQKSKNDGVFKAKPAPPPPSLSKSDIPGKGSVRSIQTLNKRLTVQPKKQDTMEEYDSDNLEENLEFFEPGSEEITFKFNASKVAKMSTKSKSSSLSSEGSDEKVVPTQKLKLIKPDKTTTNVFSGLSGVTQDSSDDIFDDDSELSARNASMNRWQNSVSLHEIDDLASNNATRVSSTNKKAASGKPAGKVGRSSSEDYGIELFYQLLCSLTYTHVESTSD